MPFAAELNPGEAMHEGTVLGEDVRPRPASSADDRAEPRFCYLVLSHRDEASILRLVRRLRALSPHAHVVVRHDQEVEALSEASVRQAGGLPFPSQLPVSWGDWSMVEAELEVFRWIQATLRPDWLVLISGQDYPVRDLRGWEREVVDGGAGALVAADPLVVRPPRRLRRRHEDWIWTRYHYRWVALPRGPRLRGWVGEPVVRPVRRVWFHLLAPLQRGIALTPRPVGLTWQFGIRRRDAPFGPDLRCYMGEQWMAVSARALNRLLEQDARQPQLRRYYRRTVIPDESYLQTLLCNDQTLAVERRGVSWHRFPQLTAANPEPLTLAHLDAARGSGLPFARKLDPRVDPRVADELDRLVDADRRSVGDSGTAEPRLSHDSGDSSGP